MFDPEQREQRASHELSLGAPGATADIQRIRSERDQAEILVLQRLVGLRALREELDEALGEAVVQGRLLNISWARMAEPSGFSATGLVARYKERVEQTLEPAPNAVDQGANGSHVRA